MSQIVRVARAMKVTLKSVKASIKLNLTLGGSVLAQTVQAGIKSVETHYDIESDADREKVAAVIRNSRNACFTRQALTNPTPFEDSVKLNGEEFVL